MYVADAQYIYIFPPTLRPNPVTLAQLPQSKPHLTAPHVERLAERKDGAQPSFPPSFSFSLPRRTHNMNDVDDEYHWIAGNDPSVCHKGLIDSGSFGRVHQVNGTLARP